MWQHAKNKAKRRNQRYYRACMHFQEINCFKIIECGKLGMFKHGGKDAHYMYNLLWDEKSQESRNQRGSCLAPEKQQPLDSSAEQPKMEQLLSQ